MIVVVTTLLFVAAIGPPARAVAGAPRHIPDAAAFGASSSSSSSLPLLGRLGAGLGGADDDLRSAHRAPPPPPPTPSTAVTTGRRLRRTMHLVSLPPHDDTYALPCEDLVRECWRWKDAVLGDGRDYFNPRPRALSDFHSLFVGMEIDVSFSSSSSSSSSSTLDGSEVALRIPCDREARSSSSSEGPSPSSPGEEEEGGARFVVEECAALSNCARLDVVLVLRSDDAASRATAALGDVAARRAVARVLRRQALSRRHAGGASLLERTGLASWLDLPGAMRNDDGSTSSSHSHSHSNDAGRSGDCGEESRALASRLSSMEGDLPVCTHLSLVASGLSPRPNRPDREVLFRPYSSRDAREFSIEEYIGSRVFSFSYFICPDTPFLAFSPYKRPPPTDILLQLKRTVEVVSVLNDATDSGGGGRGRIKTLLNGALHAGKAARNERVVPEIRRLREFGSDGTPPSALARVVAEVRDWTRILT
jgi:hypothetical protein